MLGELRVKPATRQRGRGNSFIFIIGPPLSAYRTNRDIAHSYAFKPIYSHSSYVSGESKPRYFHVQIFAPHCSKLWPCVTLFNHDRLWETHSLHSYLWYHARPHRPRVYYAKTKLLPFQRCNFRGGEKGCNKDNYSNSSVSYPCFALSDLSSINTLYATSLFVREGKKLWSIEINHYDNETV